MNINKQRAFTLVELIVVITILAILWTIAFISLQWYSSDARDSTRISDVWNMKTSLELFHLNAWKYPLPDDKQIVDYGWETLWYQWKFWNIVVWNLSRNLSEIPTDSLTDKEYIYSVSWNKNEFQILNLLEWEIALSPIIETNAAWSIRTTRVEWNYNGVFLSTEWYIVPVPSIITSEDISSWLTLSNANIKSQVTNNWNNIPKIWNITTNTWNLTGLVLSVYTWSVTKKTSNATKALIMWIIQDAYTWSSLKTEWIYEYILGISWEEDLSKLLDTVILNDSTETVAWDEIVVNIRNSVSDCLTSTWEILYETTDWTDTWLTCNDDIIVCNGTTWSWYVIKSCNQWATTVYTDQTFVSDTTVRSSWVNEWAGWLYQWWNNEDVSFATADSNQVSSSAIDSSYNGNGNFIYSFTDWNSYWTPATKDNMWWDVTNTYLARKWPCDGWYHIPSITEWTWLHTTWLWSLVNWTNMSDDLKMPFAGRRLNSNGDTAYQGIAGNYWYSTPHWNDYQAYYFYFSSTQVIPWASHYRAHWYSIRCFKN